MKKSPSDAAQKAHNLLMKPILDACSKVSKHYLTLAKAEEKKVGHYAAQIAKIAKKNKEVFSHSYVPLPEGDPRVVLQELHELHNDMANAYFCLSSSLKPEKESPPDLYEATKANLFPELDVIHDLTTKH